MVPKSRSRCHSSGSLGENRFLLNYFLLFAGRLASDLPRFEATKKRVGFSLVEDEEEKDEGEFTDDLSGRFSPTDLPIPSNRFLRQMNSV